MTEKKEVVVRKRRTKEEIEAAKASGTYKSKCKVKKVEETRELFPKEKHELKPEESILIMSCLNPVVSEAAINKAKEIGVEVVILEDRVIHDYLNNKYKQENSERSLGDFLNNTSNRLHAEEQCVKLWTLLTVGEPIENAEQRVFTRTEVVKKTNLSHGKADKIFQLLRAFGMLEFVKGNYEFKLHFSKKRCHETIKTEIISMIKVINNDILRFKSSIDNDSEMTNKQRNDFYKELREAVNEAIEY